MLTTDEENYLSKIDPAREVSVYPHDPHGKELGEKIVANIIRTFPTAKVLFMGSTALKIAGQRDIDIYILAKKEEFNTYLPGLEKLFGEIVKKGKYVKKDFIEWKFKKEGYDIEIYLTEPPDRQIKVYEILKENEGLRKEYEQLKMKFNGKSYKDYQRAKYEFYNKILR